MPPVAPPAAQLPPGVSPPALGGTKGPPPPPPDLSKLGGPSTWVAADPLAALESIPTGTWVLATFAAVGLSLLFIGGALVAPRD